MSRVIAVSSAEVRTHGSVKAAVAAREAQANARTTADRKRPKRDGAPEAVVMREIESALREAGFAPPAEGGGKRGFFMRAGQHRADRSGSDAGVPDILLAFHGLPLLLGLEVKGRQRAPRLSEAQKRLHGAHTIHVVTSAADALAIIAKSGLVFTDMARKTLQAALCRKGTT